MYIFYGLVWPQRPSHPPCIVVHLWLLNDVRLSAGFGHHGASSVVCPRFKTKLRQIGSAWLEMGESVEESMVL